jgi:hypothetical protein
MKCPKRESEVNDSKIRNICVVQKEKGMHVLSKKEKEMMVGN